MIDEKELEAKIFSFGSEIIKEMQNDKPKINLKSAENLLMNWALENEDLKVNLFRLVDTLPSLHSSSEIARHIKEYFANQNTLSTPIRTAASLSSIKAFSPIVALAAKKQVSSMSKRFIAGSTPADAIPSLKKLKTRGVCFTIDLLGEAALSETESSVYLNRYLELITALSKIDKEWKEKDFAQSNHPGEKSLVNVSIKLSSLYSQTKAIDFENSVKILKQKLSVLFAAVKEQNGVAYVDMEDCSLTDVTFAVVKDLLNSSEFRKYDGFGFVVQAYLKRSQDDIEQIIEWVKRRGTRTKIRLVKGAYWDSEYIMAKQRDWPCPVFEKKEHSDASYELISKKLLDAHEFIYPAFASHNIRSLSHAICYAQALGIPSSHFETQFLYGMGDEFKDCLIEKGFLARDYTPVGDLLPGMAYLVRRLLENTANEGFLRQVNFDKIDPIMLLKKPNLPKKQ